MQLKSMAIAAAIAAAAILPPTNSAVAQGIVHSWIMRGQIVDVTSGVATLCIGRADGAKPGQTLEVFRIKSRPGPRKGPASGFKREHVGRVTIQTIIDDHFASATVDEGQVARHDIAELRRTEP